MYILIERYMSKLTRDDVNSFAIKNNVNLSDEELDFTYKFVLNNWKTILSNHGIFDLSKYKEKFSEENFNKIQLLIKQYMLRYRDYL